MKGEEVPDEVEAELDAFSEASLRAGVTGVQTKRLPGVNGAYQQDQQARLLDKIKQHARQPAEVPGAPG